MNHIKSLQKHVRVRESEFIIVGLDGKSRERAYADLDKFFRKITNYLNRKSAQLQGNLCLVCKESDETITLTLNKGRVDISNKPLPEKLILTRRQLAQLIFGHHPKAKPVTINRKAGKILKKLFPFYFPVWQLDHS